MNWDPHTFGVHGGTYWHECREGTVSSLEGDLVGTLEDGWMLMFDINALDIEYCPFCGVRLPQSEVEWLAMVEVSDGE